MRVLSLDLDFFLDRIHLGRGEGRLDPDVYTPWPPEEVEAFLREQCGLGHHVKPRGRFATHHDAAFHYWRELVERGELKTPFEVVHIDAHADLGIGDDGYLHIMGELLYRPVEERAAHVDRLEEGNFLAYALACRWISSLTFVHPVHWGGRDLNFHHFLDFDEKTGWLELKRVPPARLRRYVEHHDFCLRPYEAEPLVPFRAISAADYQEADPFDFMFVCQSPEYTPPTADVLLETIAGNYEL